MGQSGGDVDSGEAVHVGEQVVEGKSLYFSLHFARHLTLL